MSEIAVTTSSDEQKTATSYDTANLTASVDTSAANRRARVWGVVRNGSTAGTVIVRFASETPGQAVTIMRRSYGVWYQRSGATKPLGG